MFNKQKDKLKKIAIPKNFDRKSQEARKIQRVNSYKEKQESDSDEGKFVKENKKPRFTTWKGRLMGFVSKQG